MKSAIFSRFFEELPYQIGITLTGNIKLQQLIFEILELNDAK